MANTKTVRTKKTVTKKKVVAKAASPVVNKNVSEEVENQNTVVENKSNEVLLNESNDNGVTENESNNNVVDNKEVPVNDETVLPVKEEESISNETVENGNTNEVKEETIVEKKRTKPDKETLMKKWNDCFEIYADLLKTRKQPHQSVSLYNYLKTLKNDTTKILRVKNKGNLSEKKNENSGFMKPVNVSDELRDFIQPLFLNEESSQPITRVLITQKLCQYIKQKNLQKPEDKREILPDTELKKLFKITADEKEKLTYYSMQKKIQSHIFKI